MKTELLIVDGFYTDVDAVREFALQQDFSVKGNYPGNRTVSFLNNSIKETIERIVSPHAGKVTYWAEDRYTGAYQYTTSRERSWIHSDQTTNWAGVCYLTPNAPLNSGTALYRHKETGLERAALLPDGSYDKETMDRVYKDSRDMSKWDMVDMISNKFNRLVLYRGDIFHSSMEYFGKDKYTGRLFQTFFFNTEY